MSKQSIRRELTSLITNKYFRVSQTVQKITQSPWKRSVQIICKNTNLLQIYKKLVQFSFIFDIISAPFFHAKTIMHTTPIGRQNLMSGLCTRLLIFMYSRLSRNGTIALIYSHNAFEQTSLDFFFQAHFSLLQYCSLKS